MAEVVYMPKLSDTMTEGVIAAWHKQVGDKISIAEPLLLVETDKAQVDVESPEEGIVLKILAEPGAVLNTGDLVAYVGNEGEII